MIHWQLQENQAAQQLDSEVGKDQEELLHEVALEEKVLTVRVPPRG